MGFLGDYKEILVSPESFFQREHSIGYALGFGLVMLLIQSVFSIFSGFLNSFAAGYTTVIGSLLSATINTVVGSVIFIPLALVEIGIIHVFVSLLGDSNGFGKTFTVVAFTTAIYPIMSVINIFTALSNFIPVVGFLVLIIGLLASLAAFVYSLYIAVSGLSQVHDMTKGQAAGAIVLTIMTLAVIAVIIFFVMLALGAALIGAVAAA
jgi:hypothetical protein